MAVVSAASNDGASTEENLGGKKAAASPSPISWPSAMSDRYKIPVLLGRGFYGRVYAAWDNVREHLVAVKQLSGRTDGDLVATGPREFEQEVAALKACRGHPNVVTFLGSFASGEDRFIVTDFAGTMDLRRYMRLRRRSFDEDEVRDAMRQMISGVGRAHKAGVLHREIVPENVVVDEDHHPRMTTRRTNKYTICGFNASQLATEKDGSSQLASPGPYRAPELFFGSDEYDGRIDSWGLGCVMAELLVGTGKPFFGAESDDAVLPGVFRVVGAKGIVEWSGFERVAASPERASRLREQHCRDTGCLREMVPEEVLSQAGFDVLSGLLQSNPDRRLTAKAALKMPWFRRHHRFGACFTSP